MVTDESIKEMNQCCMNLLDLNLSRTRVTAKSVSSLCVEAVEHSGHRWIHQLHGSPGVVAVRTQRSDKSVSLIGQYCTVLRVLLLENPQVTHESISIVGQRCSGLQKLRLNNTVVTDESISLVGQNLTGLQELCLKSNG